MRTIRQPRIGAYKLTNSYTNPAAYEQIVTIIYFITMIILHSVFYVPAIVNINHPILWVSLGFMYILLVAIIIDYVRITLSDPVDDLILQKQKSKKDSLNNLRYCTLCAHLVHKHSHHCMRCNRCSEQFDHHCTYLNNCIGGKNYGKFIRLLLTVFVYCLVFIGQGVWIFVRSYLDGLENGGIRSRWAVLVIFLAIGVGVVLVALLLGFHLYLAFCRRMSTYQYIYRETSSNQDSGSTETELKKGEEGDVVNGVNGGSGETGGSGGNGGSANDIVCIELVGNDIKREQ